MEFAAPIGLLLMLLIIFIALAYTLSINDL